jgi:glycosyltransferase involved in cell wall biosynthesis
MTAVPDTVTCRTPGDRIQVLHVIDSLTAGGAERVAVELVNGLPRDRFGAHLCTTRAEGPLADLVEGSVGRLRLARRARYDPRAIGFLVGYLKAHQIALIHAHGTSVFISVIASLFPPRPAILWHDHYGLHEVRERPARLYRVALRRADGVVCVNRTLMTWATGRLGVPADRTWYLPNFPPAADDGPRARLALPGTPGARVVCVANIRPQKDHLTLLGALAIVRRTRPDVHVLVVGEETDRALAGRLRAEVAERGLQSSVTFCGPRRDVADVLAGSDIGVLSSASEGLPLALLEYGRAGLPVVVTDVGQCREVVDEGRAGLLVHPGSVDQLAHALNQLLESAGLRQTLGSALRARVFDTYSRSAIIDQLCTIYDGIIGRTTFDSRRCGSLARA